MNRISLAVRCTREEYMNFYGSVRKNTVWTTIVGAVLLVVTVILCVVDETMKQHTLLLALIGIVLVLMTPLILPTVRKGAAGRRYDASDALKGALTITMEEDTLTVRSACQEGTVPLRALTAIEQTKDMTALVFGKELCVCIPMRTMTDDEVTAFHAILSAYKKEQV